MEQAEDPGAQLNRLANILVNFLSKSSKNEILNQNCHRHFHFNLLTSVMPSIVPR